MYTNSMKYSTVCTPAHFQRWGIYHYLELLVPPLGYVPISGISSSSVRLEKTRHSSTVSMTQRPLQHHSPTIPIIDISKASSWILSPPVIRMYCNSPKRCYYTVQAEGSESKVDDLDKRHNDGFKLISRGGWEAVIDFSTPIPLTNTLDHRSAKQ
jgi:hypothetical protein